MVVMEMDRLSQWWLQVWLFLRWIPQTYRMVLGELRPRPLELLGALWALAWGIWVGNPFWNVFPSSPTFRVLSQVAPESVWGLCSLAVGVGQLWAVYRDHLGWRYRVSVLAFLLWSFITLMFMLGNPSSTATITYGMLALMAALVVGKIKERLDMENGE